jgi:hypothetical protein
MICLFVLLIAFQSQFAHSTLVTNKPQVPARYLAPRGAQPKQNGPAITCDAKNRLADFAIALQLAIQSLDKETYLDQDVPKKSCRQV